MPRLIDVDVLIALIKKRLKNPTIIAWLCRIISEAPTIEAEPVRHGRWELKRHKLFGNSYDYVCSACGCDYALAEYNYCPHCGAKMGCDNHGNVEM